MEKSAREQIERCKENIVVGTINDWNATESRNVLKLDICN